MQLFVLSMEERYWGDDEEPATVVLGVFSDRLRAEEEGRRIALDPKGSWGPRYDVAEVTLDAVGNSRLGIQGSSL